MTLVGSQLCCRLGGRQILDGVGLAIESAKVVTLLGPNGAGKTTLLALLAGVLKPDSGTVIFQGQDITSLPLYRRSRLGIGYLPQEATVFGGLTVEQNIEAAVELRGMPTMAAQSDRISNLLERFGLADQRSQQASTLSGGERRRLELARLLSIEPKVVLLDEPFAGLDPLGLAELQRAIASLASDGVGVLLADHYTQHALTICDHSCILVQGRVIASGSAAEVTRDEGARELFFGPTTSARSRTAIATAASPTEPMPGE